MCHSLELAPLVLGTFAFFTRFEVEQKLNFVRITGFHILIKSYISICLPQLRLFLRYLEQQLKLVGKLNFTPIQPTPLVPLYCCQNLKSSTILYF